MTNSCHDYGLIGEIMQSVARRREEPEGALASPPEEKAKVILGRVMVNLLLGESLSRLAIIYKPACLNLRRGNVLPGGSLGPLGGFKYLAGLDVRNDASGWSNGNHLPFY
jgi:hypothetical protein